MTLPASEKQLLRELARKVADIAAMPIQQERAKLWKALNSLKPARPMVLISPEHGWKDLLPWDKMVCQTEPAKGWEWNLRAKIFRHEHLGDDMPITPYLDIPWTWQCGDFGLKEEYHRTEAEGSHNWDAPVKTEDDLDALHFRTVQVDKDATARNYGLAADTLGDILTVRTRGSFWWTCGLTWSLIQLRGLNQVMMDVYDNPQLLHRLMGFLRDEMIHMTNTLEHEGVLSLNNGPDDMVGSGGLGATDELPGDEFDHLVRLSDMWGLAESQEFVGIGPQQFHEFSLQYQLPVINRLGLVCYGCCEPLDQKFDLIVANIPRLRRVSVSPWCNVNIAAEKLGHKYVYSWKPNPSTLCQPRPDWEQIRKSLRTAVSAAKGCCMEIVMKDTHTFHGDPKRAGQWVKEALALAKG